MNVTPINPPRRFRVGERNDIQLSHCATIELKPDELVTFESPDGAQYDVTCKSWGYYATPSINNRLKNYNFRTALVRSNNGRHFIMLVKENCMEDFRAYIDAEQCDICEWLDGRP